MALIMLHWLSDVGPFTLVILYLFGYIGYMILFDDICYAILVMWYRLCYNCSALLLCYIGYTIVVMRYWLCDIGYVILVRLYWFIDRG